MARISEQTTQLVTDQQALSTKIDEILAAVKDGHNTSNVVNDIDEIKSKLQEIVTIQNEILSKASAIQNIL